MCAILKAVYGTVISKETKNTRAQFADFFFFFVFSFSKRKRKYVHNKDN